MGSDNNVGSPSEGKTTSGGINDIQSASSRRRQNFRHSIKHVLLATKFGTWVATSKIFLNETLKFVVLASGTSGLPFRHIFSLVNQHRVKVLNGYTKKN